MGHEPHRLPLGHDPAYIVQLSIPLDYQAAIDITGFFSHPFFFAVNLYRMNLEHYVFPSVIFVLKETVCIFQIR